MKSYLNPAVSVSALALAVAAMVTPPEALALTRTRSFIQNATGACQAALPAYEGQIRKRPLAVQNEGTGPAFITCSLMGTEHGVGGDESIGAVTIWIDNNSASTIDLTCTLVDGWSGSSPTYITRVRTVPAGGKAYGQAWYASDNGGVNFNSVNLTCNLPVGVALTRTAIYYSEDVGT